MANVLQTLSAPLGLISGPVRSQLYCSVGDCVLCVISYSDLMSTLSNWIERERHGPTVTPKTTAAGDSLNCKKPARRYTIPRKSIQKHTVTGIHSKIHSCIRSASPLKRHTLVGAQIIIYEGGSHCICPE